MDEKTRQLEEQLKEAEAKIEAQSSVIRELELRKNQYDSILENMSELVERTNPDFHLLYVNKALANFYQMSPEDLIATDTMALVYEEDQKNIYEMMKSVDAEHPYYKYEYRVEIDGKMFWMESIGRGFYREDGSVIEYQDVSRDITQFKTMEEELNRTVELRTAELAVSNRQLKKVNEYLQSILSGISEGIIVLDRYGECEFLNYGPKNLWKSAETEIRQYFKRLLNDESSNVLNWMFWKKRPFVDMEMNFVAGKQDLSFVVSGMPLDIGEDMTEKGILVLRPVTQVRRMVTRMSGAQARFHFQDIVTTSPRLMDVIAMAKQAAASDCNVLIEGESGTGKELFAQSIHNASSRRKGPFVAVNCGAIPRDLMASELFGYVDGSFTGAKKGGKPGKFELAEGGTLFLDEIGDMPLEQQVGLLRVLQERVVTRVGGDREIPVDVRVICATNRNLRQEAQEHNFREDLYYRLNVLGLHIPPLRERKEDILPLFCSFWAKNANCDAEDFLTLLQPEVIDRLFRYSWPGNVRELQNVADRMMYLSQGREITMQYLPSHILKSAEGTADQGKLMEPVEEGISSIHGVRSRKKETRLEFQRKELLQALDAAGGNVSEAARLLGVSRATFYRKLKLAEDS